MTKDISRSVRSKVLDNRLPYPLPTSVEALDEVGFGGSRGVKVCVDNLVVQRSPVDGQ